MPLSSDDSDDDAFLQHFTSDPRVARRLARQKRKRLRPPPKSSTGPTPNATVASTSAAAPPTTRAGNLHYVTTDDDFNRWGDKQRAGQVWCDVTRRYFSIAGAKDHSDVTRLFCLHPASRTLAPLAHFHGRDFVVRLPERYHRGSESSGVLEMEAGRYTEGGTSDPRLAHAAAVTVASHEAAEGADVVDFVSCPLASRAFGDDTWGMTRDLALHDLHGLVPLRTEQVTPATVLGTAPVDQTVEEAAEALSFLVSTRDSVCGYVLQLDCDDASRRLVPSVPQRAWGFHFRQTDHSFTGPVVSVSGDAAAALCDNALAWIQDHRLIYFNVTHATALAALSISNQLLVGRRSGEMLLVDPRVNSSRQQMSLGQICVASPSVVAQVEDVSTICSGLPLVLSRAVDGRVVLFDLRRAGKRAEPFVTLTEPILEGYHRCDLSAGAVCTTTLPVARQQRGVAMFSGGFHRLVGVDLITAETLLDVPCDGCTYAASMHVETRSLRPHFGKAARGEPCWGVALVRPGHSSLVHLSV